MSGDFKFYRAGNMLWQLTKINLVWLLFSLPVVTAGAASAAQFGAVGMLLDEPGGRRIAVFSVMKEGFRRHFRQATIVWLVSAALFVAFYFDYNLLTANVGDTALRNVLLILSVAAFAVILFTFLWVYAVMTCFSGKLRDVVYSAFIFSMIYTPVSLIAICIYAGAAFLFLNFMTAKILLALFGYSLAVYINLYFFKQAFRRYARKTEENV